MNVEEVFPVSLGVSHSDWETFSISIIPSTGRRSAVIIDCDTNRRHRLVTAAVAATPGVAAQLVLCPEDGTPIRVSHRSWVVFKRLIPGGESRRSILVWDGHRQELLPVKDAVDLIRARRQFDERLDRMDTIEMAIFLKEQGVI